MNFLYIFVLADVYPIKKLHFCILFPQSIRVEEGTEYDFLHMLYLVANICDNIFKKIYIMIFVLKFVW